MYHGVAPKKVGDTEYVIEPNSENKMNVPVRIFADEQLLSKMLTDRTIMQATNVASNTWNRRIHVAVLPDAPKGMVFISQSLDGIANFFWCNNTGQKAPIIFNNTRTYSMAILPIDGKRYGTPEMLKIFDEQKKIDYQLQIEGAVAISQASLKIIPKKSGQAILSASKSGKITAARVKQIEAVTDHDTAALVQALSERCPKQARPWVHYGLTSNDLLIQVTRNDISLIQDP